MNPPACIDCVHHVRADRGHLCRHESVLTYSVIDGHHYASCEEARKALGSCGERGKLFEARKPAPWWGPLLVVAGFIAFFLTAITGGQIWTELFHAVDSLRELLRSLWR